MTLRFLFRRDAHGLLLKAYMLSACAFLWRRLMFRTTFIAITGSAGKSTATACLGNILSVYYPTNWEPGGQNSRWALARIVLKTRLRHRFTVIEVGTRAPGALARASWMIAPDIAVVLRVLGVHTNAFPTIEKMAAEKEQLLKRLGRRGVAVLNADDPVVIDMARRRPGPVVTFGVSDGAFLRADQVSALWPARLSFRAHCGQESAQVKTNFLGEQLLPSALAGLATAVHCGLSLAQAVAAIQAVQPLLGRMYPMLLPNGICVIRDDFNASIVNIEAALQFLSRIEGQRRIVVIGDALDTGLTMRPRARDLGRRVAQAADVAVFLGSEADTAAKSAIAAGMPSGSAHWFKRLPEAAEFLKSELRPGDLVLTKSWEGRHVERVVLAQFGEISCWIDRCPLRVSCENCPELKLVTIPGALHPAAGQQIKSL